MKHPRRWKMILAVLFLIVVGVPSGLYGLLRSDAFLQSVVLPRVSRATGLELSADRIEFEPFSRLIVHRGTLRSDAEGIDAQFGELILRYDLPAILRGTLTVHEATLRDSEITLHPHAFDSRGDAADPGDAADLPRLNLSNLRIENGVLLLPGPADASTRIEWNLSAPRIRNGDPLPLDLTSTFTHTPASAPPVSGALDASLRLQWDDALAPTDLEGRLEATLDPSTLVPQPLHLTLDTAMGLALEAQTVDLRALSARGRLGEREILTLTLSDPTRLDLSRPLQPLASDTRLRLNMPELSLSDLPLPAAFPLRAGLAGAEASLVASGSGERVEGSLQIHLKNASGSRGALTLENWNAELSTAFTGEASRLHVDRLVLRAGPADETALDLKVDGFLTSDAGRGDLVGTLETARIQTLIALLPDPPDLAAVIGGRLHLAWEDPRHIRWDTDLVAEQPHWPGANHPPQRLDLSGSGTLRPDRVDIDTLRARWPETDGFDNALAADGFLDYGTPDALKGRLNLQGEAVDFTPWLPEIREDAPAASDDETSAPATEGVPWPIGTFTASVELERLGLPDLDLRQPRLKAEIGSHRLTIPTLSLTLNDAPFEGEGFLDWTETPPTYRLRGELGVLNLGPVADLLLPPDKQGTLVGTVRGTMDFRGKGFTAVHLRDHLHGNLEAHLTDGRIQLLEDGHPGWLELKRLARTLLHAAAGALRIPPEHLTAPPLREVDVKLHVRDGTLTLERAHAASREILLETRGRVGLAEPFPAAALHSLPVTLGVSTQVAERARVNRPDRMRDGFVVLPPFLNLTGTVSEPRIDLDKSVLAGLLVSGVMERTEFGDERSREALGLLGGLLSGEAPAPTPTPEPPAPGTTPTPTPEPGRTERVLQGLRLLQELRGSQPSNGDSGD